MRNFCGSRDSQSPLVAIDELRPVRKAIMGEEDPFLPTGTVLVDLRLEEGAETGGRWERGKGVAVDGGG